MVGRPGVPLRVESRGVRRKVGACRSSRTTYRFLSLGGLLFLLGKSQPGVSTETVSQETVSGTQLRGRISPRYTSDFTLLSVSCVDTSFLPPTRVGHGTTHPRGRDRVGPGSHYTPGNVGDSEERLVSSMTPSTDTDRGGTGVGWRVHKKKKN